MFVGHQSRLIPTCSVMPRWQPSRVDMLSHVYCLHLLQRTQHTLNGAPLQTCANSSCSANAQAKSAQDCFRRSRNRYFFQKSGRLLLIKGIIICSCKGLQVCARQESDRLRAAGREHGETYLLDSTLALMAIDEVKVPSLCI